MYLEVLKTTLSILTSSHFLPQFHSSTSFWIGFNDRENEGDWLWSDRLTSSYTNWADDAPNNGGYSCASVGKSGKWHDGKCNEKLNVVCKKKGMCKVVPLYLLTKSSELYSLRGCWFKDFCGMRWNVAVFHEIRVFVHNTVWISLIRRPILLMYRSAK